MAKKKKVEIPEEQTTVCEVSLDELNDLGEVRLENVYDTDDKTGSGE